MLYLFQNALSQPQKKAVTTTKDRNFRVLHHINLHFPIIWGVPPLVSRQVGFLANIPKKPGYNHTGPKFRGVAPQYFVFFHYCGAPTP